MSTIDDLERKVQSLRDQLHTAEASLQRAKLDACEVKVGDIVRYTGFHLAMGTLCKVNHVDVRWSGAKPWLRGNPQRKDGTYSTSRGRNLYSDWEQVEQRT